MNTGWFIVIGSIVGAAALIAAPRLEAQNAPAAPSPPGPSDLELADLAWLAGSWAGDHDGGRIEEHWMAPAGRTMSGMSRLVVNGRTAFHEYLRIRQNDDGTIDYLAQPGGRCPPTPFRLTSLSPTGAVFENPKHDDPKLIRYELGADGTLTATTEGEPNGRPSVHTTEMKSGALAPAK